MSRTSKQLVLSLGLLKPASSHMSRSQAAEVDKFSWIFLNTVRGGFQEPMLVAISAFGNPFVTALDAFKILFNQQGFEKRSSFHSNQVSVSTKLLNNRVETINKTWSREGVSAPAGKVVSKPYPLI